MCNHNTENEPVIKFLDNPNIEKDVESFRNEMESLIEKYKYEFNTTETVKSLEVAANIILRKYFEQGIIDGKTHFEAIQLYSRVRLTVCEGSVVDYFNKFNREGF